MARPSSKIIATFKRELTSDDMLLFEDSRGTKAPTIKNLSSRHHRLARLLAEGHSVTDAAMMADYTVSSVSILQADPSFTALVNSYAKAVDIQYTDLHSRLSGVAADAVAILARRLEVEANLGEGDESTFSHAALIELTKLGADRTGHGPSSTQNVNHNVNLGDRMEAARLRLIERRREQADAIDVTPVSPDA